MYISETSLKLLAMKKKNDENMSFSFLCAGMADVRLNLPNQRTKIYPLYNINHH